MEDAIARDDAATAKLMAEKRMACGGAWVCEADGVVPWLDFKDSYDQWLRLNPPQEPLHEELEAIQSLKWFLCGAVNYFCQGTDERVYRFSTDTFGKPDVFVKDPRDQVLMIGILDIKHVVDDGIRRLYAYMLITGAPFGLLIHNEVSLWYAKMEKKSAQLCVSSPISSWWGIGFLLDLARKAPLQQQSGVAILQLEKLRMSTGPDVRELFKSIAKHGKGHVATIIEGIKNIKVGDLESMTGKWFRITDAAIVSATYMGKPVVLKVRDLTTPCTSVDIHSRLVKVVTEVDMYLTLHRLQGQIIPRLISWGFMCHNMFAYVMISDEGTALCSFGKFNRQQVEAALPEAQQALSKIHARGVLLVDMRAEKFVLGSNRASSSGKLVLKIVGFSKSSCVSQSQMSVAGSLEMARVNDCFEGVLMHIQADEARAVDNLLSRLHKYPTLLDQLPEIKDLLYRLGAKLPKSAASNMPGSITDGLDAPLISAALARLVDDQNLLQHPAFSRLRSFLAKYE